MTLQLSEEFAEYLLVLVTNSKITNSKRKLDYEPRGYFSHSRFARATTNYTVDIG
jgi:hypothetical protein